ncbi:maleylpyruvate isomerase family mycothiol-dependent enzyme [Nocardioides sp. GY 10127]|uniref:maleylpyruvate isomerase family mycothiol-dependent enzyme n=1 Tax=Nocardioides sp. GY 10127 TaxID=2569762 RepID=UPI001F116985|nr:maleylpyruvate isomerase family mycothiol-dependent enzyme [Nocardioides sp. GY 10127]
MTAASTLLPTHVLLNHLRVESQRFLDVLTGCDPHARVPACPDWDAEDLVWHLTEVHSFWAWVIRHRPQAPESLDRVRPADREGLLAALAEAGADLHALLRQADPAEEAWSWAEEQTVGFTVRRQAHEALVHRLDAEQAAGCVTPLPAELAADGVHELLDVMYGGEPPAWSTFTPDGHATVLRLLDTGHVLRVVTGHLVGTSPEGWSVDGPHLVLRAQDAGAAPDDRLTCEVRGDAADLDAWLWHRRDDAGITVTGSPEAFAAFRAAVAAPLT